MLIIEVWQRTQRASIPDPGDLREVRRQCKRLLARLDIPPSSDIHSLCEHLGGRGGRPLQLMPMPLPPEGPSGLWVSTETTDYIVYQANTTAAHQLHIALHEISHRLLEHRSAEVFTLDATRLLLPHLAPSRVQQMLSRTRYSEREEQEAEILASLLRRRIAVRLPRDSPQMPPEVADVVRRLSQSLERG